MKYWVHRVLHWARQRLGPSAGRRFFSFWSGVLPLPSAGASGLGVRGLPEGLGQLPIGSPAALMWLESEAGLPWTQALLRDLLAGGPVVLLASQSAWVDALLLPSDLAQAHSEGRLRIGLLHADRLEAEADTRFRRLRAELGQLGMGPEHALVLAAQAWVQSWTQQTRIQRRSREIRRWCTHRLRPVVFLFDGSEQPESWQAQLGGLNELFPHLAIRGVTHGPRSSLMLERWDSPQGPVFQTCYGLRQAEQDGTGDWQYDGSQTQGWQGSLLEAPDQAEVWVTRLAVAGQAGVPASWKVLADYAEVQAATKASIGATVLLHSSDAAHFGALSRLVHALRQQHPRTLKIVVREGLQKLRASDEQALLRLGANAVVYREVGFTRMQQFLKDLNRSVFTRQVDADYAHTMSAYLADPLRDYLPPALFCEAVERMLQRSQSVGLSHSLLRLPLLSRVAHLDALRACRAQRDGDLLSADHDAVYVFFFACGEADVEPALKRLCVLPLDSLFSSLVSDITADNMHQTLRRLRQAARNGLPDYSRLLRAPEGAAEPRLPTAAGDSDLAAPDVDRQGPMDLAEADQAPAPPSGGAGQARQSLREKPATPWLARTPQARPQAIARLSVPADRVHLEMLP